MTDVRLFHAADGGDLEFAAPLDDATDIRLDSGLETASYLSMFGGNERDPVLQTTGDVGDSQRQQWWGNIGEPLSRQMRSETQYILRSLVATTGNLRLLEDAVTRDHQWFLDEEVASEVDVEASLVERNQVEIKVRIVVDDEEFVFYFRREWDT